MQKIRVNFGHFLQQKRRQKTAFSRNKIFKRSSKRRRGFRRGIGRYTRKSEYREGALRAPKIENEIPKMYLKHHYFI